MVAAMFKKAFTLIELLVVIAIIAILAAILFPVFAQAKAAAKDTQTLSGAKQLGLAVLQYAGDNDDVLPLAATYQPLVVGYPDTTWIETVQPYVKSLAMMHHPKYPSFNDGDVAGFGYRRQNWGVPLRAASRTDSITPANDKYFLVTDQNITGGIPGIYMDGAFGLGVTTGVNGTRQSAPSLSQSSVENISENVMMSESTRWDMMFGNSGRASVGLYGGCPGFNTGDPARVCLFGSPYAIWSGPNATKNARVTAVLATAPGYYPNGLSTYVALDGSAHQGDWLNDMMGFVQRGDGKFVSTHFWVGAR